LLPRFLATLTDLVIASDPERGHPPDRWLTSGWG